MDVKIQFSWKAIFQELKQSIKFSIKHVKHSRCSVLLRYQMYFNNPVFVYHPETKESHLTWLPTWQRHSGVLDGVFLSMRLPSAHPISESLETNADTL